MQSLFAYNQSVEANYELAKDFIKETLSPDLNSMEVQDKAMLSQNRKEALSIFEKSYKDNNFNQQDDRVHEVVTKSIAGYHSSNKKDFNFFKKHMVDEAERITDRYLSILLLLIEWVQLAEEDKRLNHDHFVKNLLIQQLKFSESLENATLRRNINWSAHKSEVRQWFKEIVKADEQYLLYLKKDHTDFEQDKQLLNHLVKTIVFKSDLIDTFFEEADLNWEEDRAIIKSMTTKTIKSLAEGDEFSELQELSYNWEDDKAFFKKLFEETVGVGDEYEELIAKKTRNWDIDRLAITDKIVLEMAICEIINFPSIPVKVTINEYIEVAKRYSTPKSKLFINGVLDVIATELQETGRIKKSGRGLIDNK